MKIIFIISGSIALALGIMGIFMPLLPTTPFLLLAAALFFRSSPRLYEWLLNQKRLGPYIRNFREYKAIPLRAKIISVSMVWLTLLYCAYILHSQPWLSALMIALAIAITWHILSYKTLRWFVYLDRNYYNYMYLDRNYYNYNNWLFLPPIKISHRVEFLVTNCILISNNLRKYMTYYYNYSNFCLKKLNHQST